MIIVFFIWVEFFEHLLKGLNDYFHFFFCCESCNIVQHQDEQSALLVAVVGQKREGPNNWLQNISAYLRYSLTKVKWVLREYKIKYSILCMASHVLISEVGILWAAENVNQLAQGYLDLPFGILRAHHQMSDDLFECLQLHIV